MGRIGCRDGALDDGDRRLVHGGGKPGVVGGVALAMKRKKAPVKKRVKPAKWTKKLQPFPLSVEEMNRITARNERCRC